MKIIVSEHNGFCFGVQKAVDAAYRNAGVGTYTYGEIIHNPIVTENLKEKGVVCIESLDGIEKGKIIIRSHGVKKSVYDEIEKRGLECIDATCPFVKKIQDLAKKYHEDGYGIVIVGNSAHPEVIGINGWCEGAAFIVDENTDIDTLNLPEKLMVAAQTTFSPQKYAEIVKKISKQQSKTVEIFDTICYTTVSRLNDAVRLSGICDVILVIGSSRSSNTVKLKELVLQSLKRVYLIERITDLKDITFFPDDTVGIIAGASAPTELTMEVKRYMSQNIEADVQSEEFKKAVEDSFVSYKEGRRIKGTVIAADEKGIKLNIGGKQDGFIRKEDVNADGTYNPEDYTEGTELETKILKRKDDETGCVLLSKKEIDLIKEADKIVETIRNGEYFDIAIEKNVKGGLLSKLGNYTVFIPASHIQERFINDLKPFVGKTLKVTALEIDDNKHKIVASHKKVVETERKEREEVFWTHIVPNVVVSGVVKRVTNFGAFVSVDGVDCLAHIVDLSWSHIKTVDEVLKVGESYEFLVLSADREKNRVSLGYKQLQPHPFIKCMESHPVGSVLKGKVVSIVPFGVFVEIEPHIEGLVHVSEVAHNFVKNINEVIKIGDEVEVKIMNYDEGNRKINLSIKACLPEEEAAPKEERTSSDKRPRKSKSDKSPEGETEWNEDAANNPFADLLKGLDITAEEPGKKTKKTKAAAETEESAE